MSNFNFNPEVQPLEEIFGKSEYHIPSYQRPYSWKKDQVEQLWYDLIDSYNSSLEDESSNDEENYFLGSIVLVQKSKKNNKLFYDVVDGQQRLTTLTILFCALRDMNLELPDWLDKRVRECIIDNSRGEEENKLILSPKENDKGYFSQKIQKSIDFTDNRYKNENQFIENAFVIKNLIEESINKKDSEYYIDSISSFVEFLLEKVVIIKITCSNLNFAIRLFSIINDRGLNLTSTDIIKAKLFERMSDNEEDMSVFSREWDRVEDICKDTNESMSNLFDIYFHYLTGGKAQSALNNEFDKLLSNRVIKMDEADSSFKREYLYDKSSLDIIMEINYLLKEITEINRNTTDPEICMLKYLEQSTYWKSVLATAKKVNYPYFNELKSLLVKYYYQSWIADSTANRVKQTSFKVLRAVKNKENIEVIKDIVLDNLRKYNHYFDYLNGDNIYYKKWAKPILILLEYNYVDSVSFIEISRDLHVEHILPQEWNSPNLNWVNYFTDEQANKVLNSLGNLTLLKGSKNIQASNSNFLDKKDVYKGKFDNKVSSFELTRRLADFDEWTDERIQSRQKEMIQIIQSKLDIN